MVRDREFLETVTDAKDKSAYVDEWQMIAPTKLDMLKKRIKDKFKEVLDFVTLFVLCHIAIHC